MSRVKCLKVEITQNSLLKTVAEVPQWEAQVLFAVWGEDAIVKDEVVVNRPVPDAADEFTRLANKYGPKDADNPYVARVYGNFGPGVRSLEKEIDASVGGKKRKKGATKTTSPAETPTDVSDLLEPGTSVDASKGE